MRNLYQILIDEHAALVTTTRGTPAEPTCPTLAKYLEEEIREIDRIQTLIQHAHTVKAKEKIELEKRLQIQNEKIAAFQKACKHRVTKHYPDAAGGNDSWTECTHCGASV